MLIFVSGATATLRSLPADAPVGHLLTPHTGNKIESILSTGRPIALDNGCFGGLDLPAIRTMVKAWYERLHDARTRVLWAVVPDAVGDHKATLRLFMQYADLIAWAGLQLAFVAQDGCEPVAGVPWESIRCLFIGGAPHTNWKESDAALRLMREAKRRGKWVHVGRVNSERRLRLVESYADSIDGTQFSRYSRTYLPRWCERVQVRQTAMEGLI